MNNQVIDINVDVGEGMGNEFQLMPYISSCNIACGGHAGNFETMGAVVKLAKRYRVKIGAHPSFPDKENFGRKVMDMPYVALYTAVLNQIKDLLKVLDKEKATLHHVKLHGALYNLAAVDDRIANVMVEVMKALKMSIKLYVPYNSIIADVAIKNNTPIMYEAFADRNYNDDLTLVSRTENNAMIKDADVMFEHVFQMISSRKVKTANGALVSLQADTFCIHGDNQNAVDLITSLATRLEAKGIKIN